MSTPIPQNHAAFTGEELLSATSATVRIGTLVSTVGVATDTREDLTGKAFVALRGERFDAHDYLEKAVSAGAAALIVEPCAAVDHYISERREGPPVLVVSDSLVALGDLAAFHRARWGGRIAAVAGSAGKTTTRSALSALMEQLKPGETHSTRGNLNNRIGVPMTLLGLTREHRFGVVELGTNCPGEVAELTRQSEPNVAVLTLIDLEHTEGLGDLDGVEAEEKAVFSRLGEGGVAIGFGEDERVLRSIEACRAETKRTYGFAKARELRITDWRFRTPELGVVELHDSERAFEVVSPLVGRPGALAVAASIAAAQALSGEQVQSSLAEAALAEAGEPGRNTILRAPGDRVIIDDTYNSNPASVENSIETGRQLARSSGGRLWLVLGEMLELGRLSEASHRQMGEVAANSGAAGVFFIQGDASISLQVAKERVELACFHDDSSTVSVELAPLVQPKDVVVVKASRGVRAERVVEGLAAFWGTRVDETESALSGVDL